MMAAGEFKAKLAPASSPHSFATRSVYTLLVKGLFVRYTVVLMAAACQVFVCLLLPSSYAVVPSATLLVCFVLSAVIHGWGTSSPSASSPSSPAGISNPYTEHAVPGRATAQLPGSSGIFGPTPGAASLVVFNLGIQWNHPLGLLCPGGPEVARRFLAMNAELLQWRDELGLVGASEWRGAGTNNASTFVLTYYFRDVESIHRFAHQEAHRAAWDWYNRTKLPHLGIFHETFVVPAHSYETIYANCIPVSLGRGSVRCPDADGAAQWFSTLVSADTASQDADVAHGRHRSAKQ